MRPADNYDQLIEKINIFIKKYHFNNLLRGLIFLCAGLFSAYLAIIIGEYFGNFNIVLRTILFYFFILFNLGLMVWLVIPPLSAHLKLRKGISYDEAAEIIGKHFADVNDKLLNTLQLKRQITENPAHRELLEASINQRIETLKPVSFPSAINLRENNRYLKWVIPPVAVICIIALAAPTVLTESTKRLIQHNRYFAPVAPFKFIVQNQNLSATQGQDFKLNLKLSGDKLPNDVYIETGNTVFKLDKENISRFYYNFSNVQKSVTFRFLANGFQSEYYDLKVNLKPVLLRFDAQLVYPAYLHKKTEIVNNAGDMSIPAGTMVKWTFHTQHTKNIAFYLDGHRQILTTSGNDKFEHQELITQPSAYAVSPLNENVTTPDSASYRINIIADEAPYIEVQEKPDSVSMNAFYFTGKIQDDHGFSSLKFMYRILGKGSTRLIAKPVNTNLNATQSGFFYFWDLKKLGINPGDEISYYFEVADNDGVAGPKTARTPERKLNVPDAAALARQLNAGTQSVKQKMQSAVKLAGQIEKSAQKLNESLLDKNNLSFDEKKQVEDLLQKRKDLDELVKDIQAENKKNLYNRQENMQQTQELVEMQKQIENLFNNVLDPKTREMLEKLQQLLQQNQKDNTRDELSKMQMDNKSLKKELDRILDLYKQLDIEQKLNQNINQLNSLANEQQKLADQTKKAGDNANDLLQQQKLNQAFEAVRQSLSDLQKTAEQNGNTQFKNPQPEQQDISRSMQEGTKALKDNNRQHASDAQQQAVKKMEQLAKQLQDEDSEGQESQNAIDARQLRELLKSLVNSSFAQEKLMQSLNGINSSDPNYTPLAQKQKDIKDNLKTAEDSLYALSRRVPQIQSAVNKEITGINDNIDKSLEQLGERKTPEALRNQQLAMTAMNNLALMLSEALEQLQKQKNKSGKGKGNQQSLSQLRKMQQQLNKNMQQAREQMQKNGNKPDGKAGPSGTSEQFAKMARQQQMIRQTLQQLNRENNKDGTNGLGNLDKIVKEMEQTENDLVNRKITDEAIKRQQQIQTRLLEAEKAEQEREQDKNRESKAAKDMPPGYIKALQDYEQIKSKQTEQIRTVPPSLNLYYRQKIKHYFDQLNAK
ncbi:DUF4175 family protein [Mucilaginibacter litoreus]|uniref:DUF4175 family protein n=1 Tax=Mucilaginibacter litoreus TaxID=1048221 RepID=A0ABW3AWM4_9SPHI